MIKLADLISSLSDYLEAKRQLDACRRRATGDVEYYSYSFSQDLERAERGLAKALDGYIDQRVTEEVARLATPAA